MEQMQVDNAIPGDLHTKEDLEQIKTLFDKLNTTEESVIFDAVLDIKRVLQSKFGYKILTSPELKPYLEAGLVHPSEQVNSLTLNQISRLLIKEDGIKCFEQNNFLDSIVKYFEQSTKLALLAEQILVVYSSFSQDTLSKIFQPDLAQQFTNYLSKDPTFKFRVYSLFVSISLQSPEHLRKSSSYLHSLINDFRQDKDVLNVLNYIELIEKLSTSQQGLDFILQESSIFTFFSEILNAPDSMLNLIIGNILRLIGKLSVVNIEFIKKHDFLESIAFHLNSENFSNVEAAITFIGNVGSTSEGLKILLEHKSKNVQNENIFLDFVDYVTSRRDLLQISCLHAIAQIMDGKDDELTKKVFGILGDRISDKNFMGFLMKSLSAEEELRFIVYSVMVGMAKHEWGVEVLLRWPGFLETVLNRKTEEKKIGKEWKYNVLDTVEKNASKEFITKCVGASGYTEIIKYLRTGVFSSTAELSVKVADSTG